MMKKQNKNKGIAPPRYDEAFKAGAVRLVSESNRTPKEVAAELGICIDTIRAWLKAAGAAATSGTKPANTQRVRELETENRALKRALAEREESIEILKKSIGIVSRP